MGGALKAYYSIVQYMPCPSRMEAQNAGVVIFIPSSRELYTRISLGKFRDIEIHRMVDSFGLRVYKEQWKTLEDMQHFIDSRANQMRMTDARPMKLTNPIDDELNELFEELVL